MTPFHPQLSPLSTLLLNDRFFYNDYLHVTSSDSMIQAPRLQVFCTENYPENVPSSFNHNNLFSSEICVNVIVPSSFTYSKLPLARGFPTKFPCALLRASTKSQLHHTLSRQPGVFSCGAAAQRWPWPPHS